MAPAPTLASRHPPPQPKIPFESRAVAPAAHDGGGSEAARKSRHRHGFFAGFRSRRNGRHRVVAFILLPLAVLATAAFVVWLLRFG